MNHPLFMSLRQNKTRSKPASKSKKTVTPTGLFNFQNTHISSAKPLPQKSKLAVKSAVDPLRPIAEPYQPPAETRVPASFNPVRWAKGGVWTNYYRWIVSLLEKSVCLWKSLQILIHSHLARVKQLLSQWNHSLLKESKALRPLKKTLPSLRAFQSFLMVCDIFATDYLVIPSTIYEQTEVQGVSFFVDRNLPLDGPEVIPQLLSRCNASVVLRPDEVSSGFLTFSNYTGRLCDYYEERSI